MNVCGTDLWAGMYWNVKLWVPCPLSSLGSCLLVFEAWLSLEDPSAEGLFHRQVTDHLGGGAQWEKIRSLMVSRFCSRSPKGERPWWNTSSETPQQWGPWPLTATSETGVLKQGFPSLCVHVYECVYKNLGQRVTSGVSIQELLPLISHWPRTWLGWLTWELQGSACLHLPRFGAYESMPTY